MDDGKKKPAEAPTLTTRQGHPVYDNQNNRTVGERGPTVLENYHFLEKISHFDRERIPERVVHARGAGAHGCFEATGMVGNEPISKYTRAKLFQQKGKRTPLFVRFSTVIHGGHLPGARYRSFEAWERDELIKSLGSALQQCDRDIQRRMVWHLSQCDADHGQRAAQGLGVQVEKTPPPGVTM